MRGGAPLVQADAAQLPLRTSAADAVVSGFAVRNFADLTSVMDELGRVLRPGGSLALLEVGEPQGPLLRFGHRVWFARVVPRLGGLLSDGAAYRYLPRSVAYLPSFPEIRQSSPPCRLHGRQAPSIERRHRPMCHRDTIRRQRQLMNRRRTRLFYAARPIDAGTLARLRVHAYETGRVVERDGLMVFGFGTATLLELSGGLANPLSLRQAVADLGAIPRIAEGCSVGDAAGLRGQDVEPVPVRARRTAFRPLCRW